MFADMRTALSSTVIFPTAVWVGCNADKAISQLDFTGVCLLQGGAASAALVTTPDNVIRSGAIHELIGDPTDDRKESGLRRQAEKTKDIVENRRQRSGNDTPTIAMTSLTRTAGPRKEFAVCCLTDVSILGAPYQNSDEMTTARRDSMRFTPFCFY
ncbi:hypothetical protein [Noviherbaspirillum saxi]|uniref:hypothetical protein n=1 Tax=Noviherbaspirillum saxi TaxID=2320863 RepID=UPI001F236425|nr:hypothetical protein [Noviherbaspirillum saxi]